MVNGQKVYQLEDSILYEAYQNNLTMLSPCPQQINDPQEARITVRAQKLERSHVKHTEIESPKNMEPNLCLH